MSPLWTFKIKSFCLFKTTHQNFYILFSKSILLLFFIFVYIIPHFLIFFNSFIFFEKFQTKKIFLLILYSKINTFNNFSKIFSKSAWLLEKERVYYVCKGKEVKEIMVKFYKKKSLEIKEVTFEVNIIIFKLIIKFQLRG